MVWIHPARDGVECKAHVKFRVPQNVLGQISAYLLFERVSFMDLVCGHSSEFQETT
jgi:hypothetical protein